MGVLLPILKFCYDKAGNLPNKGRHFNTQTWGKIVYFLFVWLVGIVSDKISSVYCLILEILG